MKAKNEIYHLQTPWKEDAHSVWLASTLRLSRNIAKYKFPSKLDAERKAQLISALYEPLKECKELSMPQLFRSEQLKPLDKEFLLEHFLSTNSFYQAHSGEGFVVDNSGSFLGVINLNNHLTLQINDTKQEIEKSWNRLSKVEECIGKKVDFAFDPRFGFLTSDPRECGTALVISLYLHVPAVIHMGELAELLEKDKEEEIEVMGLQGSPSEMIGDILIAKNACTVGVTEEYLLTSLRMWATRAVVAELSQRKKLKENNNQAIKNKVGRALGLLTHSYQLETIEALNALSLVKLGVELGWISASPGLNLNQVFFDCRRAHLLNKLEEGIDIPQLPRKRAEYLHNVASQLTLAI